MTLPPRTGRPPTSSTTSTSACPVWITRDVTRTACHGLASGQHPHRTEESP
ncbi:hypothetical protein [Ornithinimicrobium kibberense]|uniref:hypothetical protein n=1 Tax=Ornithinimicrobium kibberense TaxID=282060 RepID=UPI0036231A53